jgi:hypothetical protein
MEAEAMGTWEEELRCRLTAGESLEIFTGGGSYEVWTEPYANPPVVVFEGHPMPYRELERVIAAIRFAVDSGEVTYRWVEARGAQVPSCEAGYRQRATE